MNDAMILEVGGVIPRELAVDASDAFTGIEYENMVQYEDPDFEFRKCALNRVDAMPEAIADLIAHLQSRQFVWELEAMTGILGLETDPNLWGGGIHATLPGGYLALHRDFNVLPTSYRDPVPLRRALNLILYLTPNYLPEWGGQLELWDETGTNQRLQVAPEFGRAVLFDPSRNFHGHPHPWNAMWPRQSVAVYYYVRENVPQDHWRSTEYLPLPWKEDTAEARMKRVARANARERYARYWP